MAKWGEGDPRWIVEERPDAKNVNNWHWTEKNATSWSKDVFVKLFQNFSIDGSNAKCTIEELEKCSGEATVNNRKGKIIYFYEWELCLKWKGWKLNKNSSSHTGKVSVPNLSEENELKDIEITITIDESNDTSEVLKEFMYNVGREKIRERLSHYITALKEEYSKDLILPTKTDINKIEKIVDTNLSIAKNETKSNITLAPASSLQIEERSIIIEEDFLCSVSDLYDVLINPSKVQAFTRGPAIVDAKRGGRFDLYGGHVQGYFEELVPPKKLELKWRLKSWPLGHYSKVVIELEKTKNSTQMKMTQSGVPASEYEAIKTNWYRYYWHSIKQTFGFGLSLSGMF